MVKIILVVIVKFIKTKTKYVVNMMILGVTY